MKTQIKQWGTSAVIVLDPNFLKFYRLNIGDWIDLSDIVKVKRREDDTDN